MMIIVEAMLATVQEEFHITDEQIECFYNKFMSKLPESMQRLLQANWEIYLLKYTVFKEPLGFSVWEVWVKYFIEFKKNRVCKQHALFFFVRLAAHVANGWKFLIRPSSGKDTAKTKGVLFMETTMINARGIWRKVEANLWSDEQKSHQAIVKDKTAKQAEVQ